MEESTSSAARLMRGFPPAPHERVATDTVHSAPRRTFWFMRHVREATRTADVSSRQAPVRELPQDPAFLDRVKVANGVGEAWTVSEMLAATATDAFIVLRAGAVLYERYFRGMRPESTHAYYSVSKSVGGCVVARLVDQGLLELDVPLKTYVPELAGSAYADATVRHLLNMSVGIRYIEDYEDDGSHDGRLQRLYGYKPRQSADEPGSTYDFATSTSKDGEHGNLFHYVSLNINVLGWVMERVTGTSVPDLIAREIWSQLGGEHDAYIALDGAGSAVLEAGFCSSLRDLARLGQMICQGGVFGGRAVVPAWWIVDARENGDKEAFAASADAGLLPQASYRNCFWVSEFADHTAIMGLGKYGQMLYVNQEAGVVIAKFSSQSHPSDDALTTHSFAACDGLAQQLAR